MAPVTTCASQERYHLARKAFESRLPYLHLSQLEAVTMLMEGRYNEAIQRLFDDGFAGNPALKSYMR
jgi:hypothetical protein